MTAVPTVLVHGGSGTIRNELQADARAGVLEAARIGREALASGGTCVDAVVGAIRWMEDAVAFNAGRGSCMTREAEYEMDAGIMRSRDRRSGALAAVPDLRDAIVVARAIMEHSDHHVLVGQGVVEFAGDHGVGIFGREQVWTDKAQARFDEALAGGESFGQADTVGAVVLDSAGNLCAGGSTGGVLLKHPGRVGDTPLIGSGFYADPALGAACATGVGEAILTRVASYELLRRIHDGIDPQRACELLCDEIADDGAATVGLLAIMPDGRLAVAHASEHMSWAIARGSEPIRGGLARDRGRPP